MSFPPALHAVVLFTAAAVQAATPGSLSARIERVEHGLQAAVSIAGAPQPRWTIAERMKHYKVPGVSVAVVTNGRVEWARGYGVVAENGRPVDTATLFQAASISKPVAAMVVLSLVDRGELRLDDDVNQKLRSWKVPENEFTKTEKVTLRRLLSHSAGLTVHGFGGYAAGAPVPTLVEVLDGSLPANSPPVRVDIVPGERFRYSGGGYEVMQQLVMDVTGKRFPELAEKYVLSPLRMTRSTYQQPLPANETNAAEAHRGDGRPIPGRWHTYPEMTAAGLWTTPTDLAQVIIDLQSEHSRVLRTSTREAMLTKQAGDYGLGLGLGDTAGRKSFTHGGSNAGFRCMLFGYRDGGAGAVVMTNGDAGSGLADEILRSIASEYGWPDFKAKERRAVRVSPETLREYAGRYSLAPGFDVEVRFDNGRLLALAQGHTVELFARSQVRVLLENSAGGRPPRAA